MWPVPVPGLAAEFGRMCPPSGAQHHDCLRAACSRFVERVRVFHLADQPAHAEGGDQQHVDHDARPGKQPAEAWAAMQEQQPDHDRDQRQQRRQEHDGGELLEPEEQGGEVESHGRAGVVLTPGGGWGVGQGRAWAPQRHSGRWRPDPAAFVGLCGATYYPGIASALVTMYASMRFSRCRSAFAVGPARSEHGRGHGSCGGRYGCA